MPSNTEAGKILLEEIRRIDMEKYENEERNEIDNVSKVTELKSIENFKPQISVSQ